MIRFAQNGDHPQLKALWVEAFGDPLSEIDVYFAQRHQNAYMLVDVRENTVAGMLSMLPLALDTGSGQALRARYIYAVATAVPFRRQGISSALLRAAQAHIKASGEAAAVLVPASTALFDYYARREYETAFYVNLLTLSAKELPPFLAGGKCTACTAAEYKRARDMAFQNSSLYARWSESDIAYAIRTFAQSGGVAALSWEGGRSYAAWEQTDNGVLVRELALLQGDVHTALSVLHQQLNAPQYTVRLAEGTLPSTTPQPFGMIRWMIPKPNRNGQPPYLSLAMD